MDPKQPPQTDRVKPPTRGKPLVIRLTAAEHRQLQAEADAQGKPMADIVRERVFHRAS